MHGIKEECNEIMVSAVFCPISAALFLMSAVLFLMSAVLCLMSAVLYWVSSKQRLPSFPLPNETLKLLDLENQIKKQSRIS